MYEYFHSIMFTLNIIALVVIDHIILPPTNKVWGKVMFLQLCVILFIEGRVSVRCHFLPGVAVPCSFGGLCIVPCCFWEVCAWSHVPSGGLCPGVLCLGEVSVQGGLCEKNPTPSSSNGAHCSSGRYASYWNAFLFSFFFCNCLNWITI